MKRLVSAVGAVMALSACSGLFHPSRPTYTLSGVVFEMTTAGQVPVQGVEVYCEWCGHDFAYSDANGFYSFPHVAIGAADLQVRKTGYTVRFVATAISGDTSYDIEVKPLLTTVPSGFDVRFPLLE